MLTLVEVKSELAAAISGKYGVHIDGYHKESTKLYFTGPSDRIVQARREMEEHISSVCRSPLPASFSPQMVNLAEQHFAKSKGKAVVLMDGETRYICSCSQENLVESQQLLAKPTASTINIEEHGEVDIETLRKMCDTHPVCVSLREKTIVIEGLVKSKVRSARKLIEAELNAKKETPAKEPLVCSPLQQLFLTNLLGRKNKAEDVKQQLSAAVSCEKDGIFLTGTTQERKSSSLTLLQQVPSHHCSVDFDCHRSIYFEMEKHILQPSGSVEWIRDGWDAKKGFKVIVFSHNAKEMEAVCSKLKVCM